MDSSSSSSNPKATLLQQDDNLSSIRERNKALILTFFTSIIILALIIGTIITTLVHNYSNLHSQTSPQKLQPETLAIREFCSPTHRRFTCVASISSAITTTPSTEPNRILELILEHSIAQLTETISIGNCSADSLVNAASQLNITLGIMRHNPDIETQTYDERREMIARIEAAIDGLKRCRSNRTGELRLLLVYCRDFLMVWDAVNENYRFALGFEEDGTNSWNRIVEDLLTVSLFGSQYFVLVILFCLFFRFTCR